MGEFVTDWRDIGTLLKKIDFVIVDGEFICRADGGRERSVPIAGGETGKDSG